MGKRIIRKTKDDIIEGDNFVVFFDNSEDYSLIYGDLEKNGYFIKMDEDESFYSNNGFIVSSYLSDWYIWMI